MSFVAMEAVCRNYLIVFSFIASNQILILSPFLFASVLICCDFCSNAYHPRCLGSKADSLPDPWHCPRCRARYANSGKDRKVKSVQADDSDRTATTVPDRPVLRQKSMRSNLSGQYTIFCRIILFLFMARYLFFI